MKKSLNKTATVTLALSQILMLGACGKFSPAEVAKATQQMQAKTDSATTPAADATKTAVRKENVMCVRTTTTVTTPTTGEAKTEVATYEQKATRVVTTSADGKTESVDSNAVFKNTVGTHAEDDKQVPTVLTGSSVLKMQTTRSQNADGTSTEVIASKGKSVADQGSYIATPAGPASEQVIDETLTSIFKIVGNERHGISIQRGNGPADEDKSISITTSKDGVKTEVEKAPPVTTKDENGESTLTSEMTCTTEIVKDEPTEVAPPATTPAASTTATTPAASTTAPAPEAAASAPASASAPAADGAKIDVTL